MNTDALIRLWNVTQKHDAGTSGARRAALVLLGLYNGPRFPFDLTELRAVDTNIMEDALAVISDDSRQCQREVHSWLNVLTGRTRPLRRLRVLPPRAGAESHRHLPAPAAEVPHDGAGLRARLRRNDRLRSRGAAT